MDHAAAGNAARAWAAEHGHAQPDDHLLAAYGRALLDELAAELRQLATQTAADVVYVPPEYAIEIVGRRARAEGLARAAAIVEHALDGA
jgi:hypothetical protein